MSLVTSSLDPAHAVYRQIIPAGDGWMHRIDARSQA